MSLRRPALLTRIGGQMALLVIASLVAIHVVVGTVFYMMHRFESAGVLDPGPGEIVASARLVATTPRGSERTAMIARIADAFPQMHFVQVAALPEAANPESPRDLIRAHLGDGFEVASLNDGATRQIFIRLPDDDVVSAHLARLPGPLHFIGNPIVLTGLLVIVSLTLLLLWAARALAAPLSAFAKAAESFSLDGTDTALPERGPEEISAVARAFNRMRDRIRRLVDDRTRMLAAMGHDLRTPITRLRLRSEFIADEDLRGQVLRDLDQMRAMTDGVLTFLRDGRAHEAPTDVDLASILQTVCDSCADIGHDVRYAGPAHLTMTARPADLQRAVANLVDNAVRYGSEVVVRLTRGADTATIEIDDDGPGIADDRKAAMLEAFVRGEEARTMDDRSGFGLGLSIARAIAEAHGGKLTLHDLAPRGLGARITLPLR